MIADETYVGGKCQKMNAKRKESNHAKHGKADDHRGKTGVVTLINRQTGEAYSRVENDVAAINLRNKIAEVANFPNIDLHTDGHTGYNHAGSEARSHEVVKHQHGEYKNRNGATTIAVESFFSQLKRSIDGTTIKSLRYTCTVTSQSSTSATRPTRCPTATA